MRLLGGKPLLAWSVEAALASKRITRTIVSTEDAEIAEIARKCGAEVIDRPDYLATDTASTDAMLFHAYEQMRAKPDYIVLLQPTVPLRRERLVDDAIERLWAEGAESIFTAHPLHFVWWREGGDAWSPVWRTNCTRRPGRQEMRPHEIYWHEDGAVYVVDAAAFALTHKRIGGIVTMMPNERTVDIDTEADWQVAEAMLRARSLVGA